MSSLEEGPFGERRVAVVEDMFAGEFVRASLALFEARWVKLEFLDFKTAYGNSVTSTSESWAYILALIRAAATAPGLQYRSRHP